MIDRILKDRENKLNNIKDYFHNNENDSLIIIKANTPGSNKSNPISYYLINTFKTFFTSFFDLKVYKFIESYDGPYFMIKVKGKNIDFKHKLINIEQSHPLGRLVDIDYYINSDKSISRSELNYPLRKCYLCNIDSYVCSRGKKHSLKELENYIEQTFLNYYKKQIRSIADYAIFKELTIENKFGLVTIKSSGSHSDMNYETMLIAKNSILQYFEEMYEIGFNTKDLTTVLSSVRALGIKAENDMFSATNNINCYKGIIFILGISVLSLGYTMKNSIDFNDVFLNVKIISKDIYDDFKKYDNTVGTKYYKEHNIKGIRGIVFDGIKVIKKHLNLTKPTNLELLNVLYDYIISVEDTVFIKRSKTYEKYLLHKQYIKTKDINHKEELIELNNYCLKHNLSFGGAADLLIVTIFFISMKDAFNFNY